MKKLLKSSMSIILAITIIFSSAYVGISELDFSGLFEIKAEAASSGTCGDNLTWELDESGTLTISGTGRMYSYDWDMDVAPWYDCSSSVYSVEMCSGVESIGSYAFDCCENLKSITIPESVTSIYSGAFSGCSSLITITIPDSVTNIGEYAFSGCISLKSITIPDDVQSISHYTFYNCKSLILVEIPDSVTSIDSEAFYGCTSLQSIIIPNSVTSIGYRAFYNCTSLTSIEMPDIITSVGEQAFYNTAYYNDSSNWENDVFYIADHLVEAKTSITGDYEIKSGVKSIATGAFEDCKSLTSITIPDGVASIGDRAFSNCTGLTAIKIPYGVTNIGYYAFGNCISLTSIEIPDTVTGIGRNAFSYTGYYNDSSNWYDCGLYIGEYLVAVMDWLSWFEIKDGTKVIAAYVFEGSEEFYSITIPSSVTNIGSGAFGGCYELDEVYITDVDAWCDIEFEDYNSNPLCYANALYIDGELATDIIVPDGITEVSDYAFSCHNIETVTLPDSLTSIGSYAFEGCTSLTTITIPDSVTSIGSCAFYECESLESINIPDGITRINNCLFYGCSSLGSVVIGDNITSIGDSAFRFCSSLTSLEIPGSVKSIGYEAFEGCYMLTKINVDTNNEYYSSEDGVLFNKDKTKLITYPAGKTDTCYSMPDSVTEIGSFAFLSCDYLTSVNIPEGVSEIPYGCFYDCKGLTSIVIPDGVSYIGSYSFYDCTSLVSVIIPDSLISIGWYAFDTRYSEDRSLEHIFYRGTQEQWEQVDIGNYNSVFYIEPIHFESTDHTAEWFVSNEPTCTQDGWKNKFCVVCNEHLEGEAIPEKGHSSDEWVIDSASTCTNNGLKHKSCDECGTIFAIEAIQATGHKAGSWKTTKKATVNAAGKKVKKCTECGATVETETIQQLKCSKPKLSKIENTADGVKITWGKVSGADKYYVYRKVKGGSYSKIGSTTKTYYTDKNAKSGKTYYYYVKAVNEAGGSDASSSKSILYLADTTLSTPKSTKSGITLKWKKVTGAEGYQVWRKTGSGSYSKIATVKGNSKVAYTDKKAKKGKTYTYKIKAYKSKTTSAYSNVKKIKDKY